MGKLLIRIFIVLFCTVSVGLWLFWLLSGQV
jgi:hypothetical protein